MNFHNSTGLSYEAEAARLAIAAGKIETEEWSHEKSKRASRILTKARLSKQGCVFPMVIWPAFRMEKYRVNDHPYHAPQFRLCRTTLMSNKLLLITYP